MAGTGNLLGITNNRNLERSSGLCLGTAQTTQMIKNSTQTTPKIALEAPYVNSVLLKQDVWWEEAYNACTSSLERPVLPSAIHESLPMPIPLPRAALSHATSTDRSHLSCHPPRGKEA